MHTIYLVHIWIERYDMCDIEFCIAKYSNIVTISAKRPSECVSERASECCDAIRLFSFFKF